MGRSDTRAFELLHADLNLSHAAVVLELRVFGHIDSRIFGLRRSERNSIEANPCFAPDLIHRRPCAILNLRHEPPAEPGLGLKYFILSGTSRHASASSGGVPMRVMLGHFAE